MSIYATILSLADDEHEDDCAVYVETSPGVLDWSGKPCSCGLPRSPYAYQGSHVLPAATDARGGGIDVAMVPDFITRDGRDDGKEGPKDWLRLSVDGVSTDGREGGYGVVVLDRPLVTELRDTLTEWLERKDEPS